MKRIILFACIVAIATVSCKKDNTSSSSICTTAMVYDGGDPIVGGLGWILVTDTAAFKYKVPDNLDNQFKIDSLMVDVCYIITDEDFICHCPPPPQKKVHLTSIKLH